MPKINILVLGTLQVMFKGNAPNEIKEEETLVIFLYVFCFYCTWAWFEFEINFYLSSIKLGSIVCFLKTVKNKIQAFSY